jgi:hypothetical protein
MQNLSSSRSMRILAMVPIFAFLVAARTSVNLIPETLVGVEADVPLGEIVTVKEGTTVLRAKLFETEIATLKEPVSVSLAKFSQDLPAGTKLDPVVVSRKTQSLTGTSGFIYCGENQRNRSKLSEALIGSFLSKYSAVVRFCFTDSDSDGRLDRVFLAGAKSKEDQLAVEIEPVAFESRSFAMDDEARILELRVDRFVRKRDRSDKIEFRFRLTKGEDSYGFSYLASSNGGPLEQTPFTMISNPRKNPYPSSLRQELMGADVEIISVDAEKGEAQIRVNRNFTKRLAKPVTIQTEYVTIYY